MAAGADPSAFVGALLPADADGRRAGDGPAGRGAAFVVEADEYAGNFDAYRPAIAIVTSAEWDHPDVFADRAAVVAAFDALAARGHRRRLPGARRRPSLVANVADAGVAELAAGLRDWPGGIVATALVDAEAQRASRASAAGMAEEFATAAGPATACSAGSPRPSPTATTLEIHGLDPLRGPLPVRLPTAGRHNAANALGVAAAALAAGLDARRDRRRASRRSPASAGGSSARARRAGWSSTTTTATIRPRSARRSPPFASGSRGAGSGPCTSR